MEGFDLASKDAATDLFLHRLRKELGARLNEPPKATGTHSSVYSTHSSRFGRNVAVKIINKKSLHKSTADKFLPREMEMTSKVHHPHICVYLGVIEEPLLDRIALVSEFCSRGTLLQLVLADGRIEEFPRGAHIFRQLIEAVQYLHSRHIVHRDIKLENLLIDSNGDIRLGDFGFARFVQGRERSRSFCGTRPYSSPQISSYTPYDSFAADWFAVGVVLFTVVTGKWPAEPVPATQHLFSASPSVPSAACRRLITSLLNEDESERADYDICVNSEWLASRPKWIFASSSLVYEALPMPNENGGGDEG